MARQLHRNLQLQIGAGCVRLFIHGLWPRSCDDPSCRVLPGAWVSITPLFARHHLYHER